MFLFLFLAFKISFIRKNIKQKLSWYPQYLYYLLCCTKYRLIMQTCCKAGWYESLLTIWLLTHSLQLRDRLNFSSQLANYQNCNSELANFWAHILQTRNSLLAFRITHQVRHHCGGYKEVRYFLLKLILLIVHIV